MDAKMETNNGYTTWMQNMILANNNEYFNLKRSASCADPIDLSCRCIVSFCRIGHEIGHCVGSLFRLMIFICFDQKHKFFGCRRLKSFECMIDSRLQTSKTLAF